MSTTATSFFGREDNQAVLRRFISALASVPAFDPAAPNVIAPLKHFFQILISNTNTFDQLCTFNIQWIGAPFIDELAAFPQIKPEGQQNSLISIFTSAYRFLCELEFSQPGELSFDLRKIKTFVDENLEKFVGIERQQLVYANYVMPANIIKKLMNSPALSQFNDFSKTVEVAKNLKESWDEEIKEKNVEIEALRDGLERITTTYNFVGLVKGFENLAAAKSSERRRTFIALIALGAVMVVPVLAQIWFTTTHVDTIDSHRNTLMYSLPALIALEVILLYFFRVVLLNFRSVTTQLLQFNLRISLCQFIQSYSEYSTKIKQQDAGALEKFENLIFSGISSGSDALPSTFDGAEQIAKLLNSLRSGGSR